jgi:glucokinase
MLIAMYLGIEIGGTKLQLGLGRGDGELLGLWRGNVDVAAGGDGIRKQIVAAVPELLASAGVNRGEVRGVGVGFGGPVDDATRSVVKSHQIVGWDGFPLADWLGEALGLPAVLGNDADVAGLAEALFGAGKGHSPILYMTIGSGIGGGIIIDGQILRGTGRGAAEIGHLKVRDPRTPDGRLETLEKIASGWAIGRYARECVAADPTAGTVLVARAGSEMNISALTVGEMVTVGHPLSVRVLHTALDALADAICAAIALVCPRRVVIGGGVSLIGERHFFAPLRERIAERVFPPFAGQTDVVPAALGEAVVVQGALALAQRTLGTAVR